MLIQAEDRNRGGGQLMREGVADAGWRLPLVEQ
jgi:hypothetical protein